MYQVIGMAPSRAFRVLLTLEELGVDYEHIPARPHTPEVLAVNPAGKIPVFRDGDDVITDSVAIMTYLADKHGKLTFPAGTVARAQQDALTQQVIDELDALLWTDGKQRFFLPEDKRVPGLQEVLKWEYANHLAAFEDILTDDYLTGDEVRLPDILLLHCLRWAASFGFPDPGPKLAAFQARMEARPAFAAALSRG